jgi:signal peptidase I
MGNNGGSAGPPDWVRRAVFGRRPGYTLARTVALVLVSFVVFRYVLLPIRVQGISMLPTYAESGVNMVNRLAYVFHPPRRGDVVSIRLAGEHVMYMKRIIALPGETLCFHDGRAYIDGQELKEPYVKLECHWEHEPVKLGPNEYYVVGDNRSMDWYGHEQGRAQRHRIVGKVLW